MGFSLPNPLNLPDPLNITDHPDFKPPALSNTPPPDPVVVVNPFLDNLGVYNSQRVGRRSLVVGLESLGDRARTPILPGPTGPKDPSRPFPLPPDLGPLRPPVIGPGLRPGPVIPPGHLYTP